MSPIYQIIKNAVVPVEFFFNCINHNNNDRPNGASLVIIQIIKNVLWSSVKSELGSLFVNCTNDVLVFNILQYLGHNHLATLVQTNNSTIKGIINLTVKQHCSKSIDMRYYWIQY